jgi:hypothetical protein
MCHSSTSANDGNALPLVLDGIEQLCEVSRGIGSTDFCHKIRLSDFGVGGPTSTFSDWRLDNWIPSKSHLIDP